MIFWCLNNKTISNYKKSTYGSFMCMLFDAYIRFEYHKMKKKSENNSILWKKIKRIGIILFFDDKVEI